MTREAPNPVLPKTTAAAPLPAKPVPSEAGAAGSWHYRSRKRSPGLYWLAILVSVGAHVVVLFGFNRKAKPVRHVVVDDAIAVKLVMPDLKDLEDPVKTTDTDEVPPDAGVPVPTLPDVPTQVDLSTAFVQQIDYNSLLPPPDLSAAKTISIPKNIGRGSRLGEGMANLFNLADLDRAPVPIVQIKPNTPPSLRRAGGSVEVRVAFIVDTQGQVLSPMAIGSTHSDAEDAAVVAISKWKFRPGMKGGRKVNVRMVQPIIFTVGDND
jgi:protein TonB